MDFALSEDQQMFQKSIKQYLESKGDLNIPRSYMNGNESVLEDLWKG